MSLAALSWDAASGQEPTSAGAPLEEQIEVQRLKMTALRDGLAALRAGAGVYVPSQQAIEALDQEELKRELRRKEYDIVLLRAFGFENPYDIVARVDVADQLRLTKISDLADRLREKPGVLRSGFDGEFHRRPDGYEGLEEAYGFKFNPEPELLEIGERYDALRIGRIAITDGFGTDGRLRELLDGGAARILVDDKRFFSRYPYPAAPLVRAAVLRRHPDIGEILNRLGGKITTARMQELNHRVEVKHEAAEAVARGFLLAAGLITESAAPRGGPEGTVIVGGKGFTEQDILCEIMAIIIEKNSDVAVVRAKRFGDSRACFEGLRAGKLDAYAEYAGTAMISCMKRQAGEIAEAPGVSSPAVQALEARLRAENAACGALECAQAFLVECANLRETSGDPVREVVTTRRLLDRAVFWREGLARLAKSCEQASGMYAGLADADATLASAFADYAAEAEALRGYVDDLVVAIQGQRTASEGRASLPVPGAEIEHAGLLDEERRLLEVQAELLGRVAGLAQVAAAKEAAVERVRSARSRSDEDTPTLDAVAAGRLVEALEAARGAAIERECAFRRAAAFVRDRAAAKHLDADAMRRRAAEAEREWAVSVWTAAAAGGAALLFIVLFSIILHRRELRVARTIVVTVVLLVGGAVAAMQFETSRRIGVAFLASAGVAGVVVGIAARSTVANAFAGVMMFLSRPVRIGDTVVIDGERGTVEDMTLMYTAFRTWDHRRVMIPNEKMSDKQIINYSIRDTRIRAKVPIHLDYAADLARAEQILIEIANESEHRSREPMSEPTVWPMAMEDQTVLLWIAVWADNPDEEWALKCEILRKALARFRKEGIPLPRRRYERLEPDKGSGDRQNA